MSTDEVQVDRCPTCSIPVIATINGERYDLIPLDVSRPNQDR